MWWLEHGVPPQVADAMPHRRRERIRTVLKLRDEEADSQRLQAEVAQEHARREAERTQPGGAG